MMIIVRLLELTGSSDFDYPHDAEPYSNPRGDPLLNTVWSPVLDCLTSNLLMMQEVSKVAILWG
jgi:hypothetical protein